MTTQSNMSSTRFGDQTTLPASHRTESPSLNSGDIIGGRFRIVRKVGEGGMAVVYEAQDEKLSERRALKFAKTGYSAQIPPETRSALRVTHENICRTYEIHTAQAGTPLDFISMEFLEGETLQGRCKRKPLSQEEVVEITKQLCQGLEAAHRAQILHRDLKGNNVMLTHRPNGTLRVVITDFGLAKLVAEGAPPTSSGAFGTPNYMAPERWKNLPASPASDVYSLGVVLYEMLTDRFPFSPEVPLATRLKSLPEPPSKYERGIDARWDSIVLGCLQPDPNKRITSPREVLTSIDRAFEVSHRRQWTIAGIAMILSVAFGIYFRESVFPTPPLARLAIMPFTLPAEVSPTSESWISVRGSLTDISARLAALGGAQRKLVVISPDELQNYKVDSTKLAATRLRATHSLSGELADEGGVINVHAAITELKTGNVLRRFDGKFRREDLAGLSTSLSGVVTSAFHIVGVPAVSILPAAYPDFAQGLALLHGDLSSYDQAIAHFEAVQKLDPRSPLVFAAMAEAYIQKFRATQTAAWLRQASAIAERAQSLNPDSVQVLLVLASVEQLQGKPELALEQLRRAAELEPNNSEVWRQMGTALDSAGRQEEAVAALRKAIELAPDYFRPHRELGTFYGRKARFTEAIEEYRIVTQLAPELPEAYSDLGGVLLVAEKEDEAEAALRQSLKLRETRPALNNLGVLLRYKHRDAEAVPVMQRALAAGQEDATLRLNLANALRRTGRIAEARENYQRANDLARTALLLNPRDAVSRARLAYSLVQLGARELAADEALQATNLAPSDYYTLYWAVMTLDALGRRADAYPLLAHASVQQLKDLLRQPDLTEFTNDARFPKLPTKEGTNNGRN
jgi:serine/threonine protein kinase/Flp pilus assembly protein TadD